MAGVDEMKEAVVKALQAKGVMGTIRANLRASVFTAITESERAQGVHLENPLRKEIGATQEGRTAVDLVCEFLSYYGMEFTLSTFRAEAGVDLPKPMRSALAREVGVGSADCPVLTALARDASIRATTGGADSPVRLSPAPSYNGHVSSSHLSVSDSFEDDPASPPWKGSSSGGGGGGSGLTRSRDLGLVSIPKSTPEEETDEDTGMARTSSLTRMETVIKEDEPPTSAKSREELDAELEAAIMSATMGMDAPSPAPAPAPAPPAPPAPSTSGTTLGRLGALAPLGKPKTSPPLVEPKASASDANDDDDGDESYDDDFEEVDEESDLGEAGGSDMDAAEDELSLGGSYSFEASSDFVEPTSTGESGFDITHESVDGSIALEDYDVVETIG